MFSKFWNFGHDKNSSRRTPRPFKNVENGDFQPFLGHILGNRCWPNVTQGFEGHFKGFRDEKYDLWASQNRIERLHTTSWVSPRYLYFLVTQKKTKNSCCFVHFPRYWEKITRCRMRTLGTVLESSDIILFRCKKVWP